MAETPSEERLAILKMLEENKITAEEAVQLLGAISNGQKTGRSSPPATPSTPPSEPFSEPVEPSDVTVKEAGKFRFFRVRVTDTRTGRAKALVTIPVGLMEWGLKIGAQFSPEVANINVADFNELMQSGIDGKLVDVLDEEDGEHVEVFVE
jgi:hypothetical protein